MFWIVAILGILWLVGWLLLAQPSVQRAPPSARQMETDKLRRHVETLSQDFRPRNYLHPGRLDLCAQYIFDHFQKAGAAVEYQTYQVAGQEYKNVRGRFGSGRKPRWIIGAHYDVYDDTPGADDNASGVAVLIELAYWLGREGPDREVELVAYTLEEPPFFQTAHMGSVLHAASVSRESLPPRGVIILEMVGYYHERWGTQLYPLPFLYLLYPARGNFLAVVGRWKDGPWIREVKTALKGRTDLPVYSLRSPHWIPGIDLSDHWSYWEHDIPAVMLTDTAFYRNFAYHTAADTADRLDYQRMAWLVISLGEALLNWE